MGIPTAPTVAIVEG